MGNDVAILDNNPHATDDDSDASQCTSLL